MGKTLPISVGGRGVGNGIRGGQLRGPAQGQLLTLVQFRAGWHSGTAAWIQGQFVQAGGYGIGGF